MAENRVQILDGIGHGEFGWDGGNTVQSVREQMARADQTKPLIVEINSVGGQCDQGIAIYNILRDWPSQVTTLNLGIAASAASTIFMSGHERIMRPGSLLYLHDPWMKTITGNAEDLEGSVRGLKAMADAMAEIYATSTGRPKVEMLNLMASETWFNADAAIEAGFATKKENAPVLNLPRGDYAAARNAPQELRAVAQVLGWSAPRQKDPASEKIATLEARLSRLESDNTTSRMQASYEEQRSAAMAGIVPPGQGLSHPVAASSEETRTPLTLSDFLNRLNERGSK